MKAKTWTWVPVLPDLNLEAISATTKTQAAGERQARRFVKVYRRVQLIRVETPREARQVVTKAGRRALQARTVVAEWQDGKRCRTTGK